jgi:hypothetical protein
VTLARGDASGTGLVPGRAIPEINKTIGEVDWDGKTVWEWGGDKAPGGAQTNITTGGACQTAIL